MKKRGIFTLKKIRKILSVIPYGKISVYAAALTYYVFLGLIPYVFVAFRIFAAFGLELEPSLPVSVFFADDALKSIIEASNAARASESVVSFSVAFYSAGSAFYKLKKLSLDFANGKDEKGFIITRFLSVSVMLAVQSIFVFAAAIGALAGEIFERKIYGLLTKFIAVVCIYFAIAVVHRFAAFKPNASAVFLSSAITLALWSAFTAAFYLYVVYFADFSKLYGTFSVTVIFFIWLYFLSAGLVAGLIFCQRVSDRIIRA